MVKIDRTEVLAIATILPSNRNGVFGKTFEIQLTEQVAAVFTLDGTLTRGEESSFVLGTKYSHFRSSL